MKKFHYQRQSQGFQRRLGWNLGRECGVNSITLGKVLKYNVEICALSQDKHIRKLAFPVALYYMYNTLRLLQYM